MIFLVFFSELIRNIGNKFIFFLSYRAFIKFKFYYPWLLFIISEKYGNWNKNHNQRHRSSHSCEVLLQQWRRAIFQEEIEDRIQRISKHSHPILRLIEGPYRVRIRGNWQSIYRSPDNRRKNSRRFSWRSAEYKAKANEIDWKRKKGNDKQKFLLK